MAVTGDILSILDKIPIWKRVQETPDRVDTLEKRVAELEDRLRRAPGLACPKCGAYDFRTESSEAFGLMGASTRRNMKCGDCGYTEQRVEHSK
jgi:predicted nucleic-acid-binding Zn-ribbon protein